MMDTGILGLMGIGGALGFSALGTSLGVGAAGAAVVGAWKRAYMQNKPANFMLLAFAGSPFLRLLRPDFNEYHCGFAAGFEPRCRTWHRRFWRNGHRRFRLVSGRNWCRRG